MSKWKFQATVNSVVTNVNSVVTVNSVVGVSAEQKIILLTVKSSFNYRGLQPNPEPKVIFLVYFNLFADIPR